MKAFTAFCQDLDGSGTVWIASFEAPNLAAAKQLAREKCAADWGYEDPDHVHVLGIAKGNVNILHWEDIE